MLLMFILVWLGCAAASLALADRKGRNGCSALLVGLLLGPLGLAIAAGMARRPRAPSLRRIDYVYFAALLVGLPALLAMWGLWAVGRAPAIVEARARSGSYPCIGPPADARAHAVRVDRVANTAYHSMGGRNYVEAILLEPMTASALRLRFGPAEIERLAAATAYAGTSERGYDSIGRRLYGAAYCGLAERRKRVVQHLSYHLPPEARVDPALQGEIDRARALLNRA